jgi:RND superfamily putative drug exporter
MKLLGDWNWWVPSWLEWLPRFDVDGEPAVPASSTKGVLA